MAQRRGVHFIPFEELPATLKSADIIVTSAGTGRYLLGRRVEPRVEGVLDQLLGHEP